MEPLTVNAIVASDRIGAVIGKQGSGLKAAREQSGGCKIDVDKNSDQSSPTRRVTLVGDANQISVAFGVMAQKAYLDESAGLPTVLIPASMAGGVCGKGGENLKQIRQASHVAVKLEREPVVDQITGAQERIITLQGDPSRYQHAMQLILQAGSGSGRGGGSSMPPMQSRSYGGPMNGGMMARGPPPMPAYMPRMAPPMAPAYPAPRSQVQLSTLSNVRPRSDDPEQLQLHMYVPSKFVGAIVGKEGATIKQTGAISGCNCSVTSKDSGERRVVVMGSYQACASAQSLLYDQIRAAAKEAGEEPMSEVKVVFLIRREAAGAIIGKQGAQMKAITEESQCQVKMEKEEVRDFRPCVITGKLQSVLAAQRLIADLLIQVPVDAQSGGKRPAHAMESHTVYDAPPPAKRPRVEARSGGDKETTKLLIPNQLTGAVIGKAGSTLKAMRESYGVEIKVWRSEEAPSWPQDRVVSVSGPSSARSAALSAVLQTAFDNQPDMTLKLLVPKGTAGAVVGKGGANLKYIRSAAGISTQLDRQEVDGDRLLQAAGPPAQVATVLQLVLSYMEGGSAPAGGDSPYNPEAAPAYGAPVDYSGYYEAGAATQVYGY